MAGIDALDLRMLALLHYAGKSCGLEGSDLDEVGAACRLLATRRDAAFRDHLRPLVVDFARSINIQGRLLK